ncbi:MAG TPA: hypothetical protein VK752_15290, partial [Bryobacteraceae bacterium]|nr:hypothetical protein [Bryobacteraceae bacterium]
MTVLSQAARDGVQEVGKTITSPGSETPSGCDRVPYISQYWFSGVLNRDSQRDFRKLRIKALTRGAKLR